MQQSQSQSSTKILGIYLPKGKVHKKDTKLEQIRFRVKPQKAQSIVCIPYTQVRQYFPYSLIQFYEERLKLTKRSENNLQNEQYQYHQGDQNFIPSKEFNHEPFLTRNKSLSKPPSNILKSKPLNNNFISNLLNKNLQQSIQSPQQLKSLAQKQQQKHQQQQQQPLLFDYDDYKLNRWISNENKEKEMLVNNFQWVCEMEINDYQSQYLDELLLKDQNVKGSGKNSNNKIGGGRSNRKRELVVYNQEDEDQKNIGKRGGYQARKKKLKMDGK